MNIKRRIVLTLFAQIISQAVVSLFGVVILKIITNNLGASGYGIYATSMAFVATFALLTDLGLNIIATREIAKKPEEAESIISYNLGLRLVLSLVIVPIISIVGFFLYPDAPAELRIGILITSFLLFFDVVWATSMSYFDSRVRSDVSAVILICQQTLFLLAVAAISFLSIGIFGFLAAYVITIALGSIAAFLCTRKYLKIRPRYNLKIWLNIIKVSIALGAISIINAIYFRIDSVMLSVLSGTTAVGIYAVAYTIINAFLGVPIYLMGSVAPSMATAKSDEELKAITQKTLHVMMIFACVMALICFEVRKDVIVAISDEKFIAAATPLAILGFASAFSYISSVFSRACIAINKHHKIIFVSLGTLALNIAINFVFIPKYNIEGAAWATCISEIIALALTYKLFAHETNIKINFAFLVKPLLVTLLVFLICTQAHVLWSTSYHFINAVCGGLFVAVTYFVLLLALGGMPEEIGKLLGKYIKLGVGKTKS